MRVPAITYGLVVSLVLALSAVYFTGCAARAPRHELRCAETGTVDYVDQEGNARVIILFACEG